MEHAPPHLRPHLSRLPSSTSTPPRAPGHPPASSVSSSPDSDQFERDILTPLRVANQQRWAEWQRDEEMKDREFEELERGVGLFGADEGRSHGSEGGGEDSGGDDLDGWREGEGGTNTTANTTTGGHNGMGTDGGQTQTGSGGVRKSEKGAGGIAPLCVDRMRGVGIQLGAEDGEGIAADGGFAPYAAAAEGDNTMESSFEPVGLLRDFFPDMQRRSGGSLKVRRDDVGAVPLDENADARVRTEGDVRALAMAKAVQHQHVGDLHHASRGSTVQTAPPLPAPAPPAPVPAAQPVRTIAVEYEHFQAEKEAFERFRHNEEKRLREIWEQNQVAMKRERQGLEKQRKAAEILPTKRERKEVELLKTAHQALQADFKEKETRMTHAYERLKRKADDLKKENSELRIRVEELARENAGLVSLERERERENRVGVRKMASFNNKSSGVAVVRHTHPKTPETVVGARQREGSEEPPVRVKSNAGVKPAPTSAVTKVRVGTAMTRMQPRSPPGEAVDALGAKARELELPEIVEQWVGDGGKTERRYANGTCLTWYQNGTIKETRESDGITKIHYAIGDWKEILPDGDTNYWFETNKALQTRFADGRTRTRYTDGQEEWQYTDGSSEIVFADRTVRITYADNGSLQEETHFPDARVQRLERTTRRAVVHVDGTVELVYEEGVKVVKRANGSVVTVARCGTRETRYLDGRVRVKAGDGRLIYETYMDDAEHERQLQALKA